MFVYILWIKVTWIAFVCVYFMDKSYLKCFCLCFKCLEFFHKKNKQTKTVLLTSILILLASPYLYHQTQLNLLILCVCRSVQPSFISRCLLKNEPITLWLTFIFIGQYVGKKIWRNLTVSQYLRPVAKMGSKPRKTAITVK